MTDERFISHAPNLEDVLLWRALSGEVGANGFYIDLGAPDPGRPSVTQAFYERGWHGLDVAETAEAAAQLRQTRPRNRVTTPASLAVEGQVKGPVHFMRIGTPDLLGYANIGRDQPWIIVVETQPFRGGRPDPEWEPALLASGYSIVWFDGLSRFYLAQEHGRLARHFGVPPNLLDNYTVFDAGLTKQLAETTASLRSLEAEVAELRRRAGPSISAPVAAPVAAAVAPPIVPPMASLAAPSAAPAITLPLTRNRLGRRIGKGLYQLVRPIARPLAWRGRQFLVGEIQAELAGLRERLDQLVARPIPGAGGDNLPGSTTMDRVLLTLAVLDARDPSPPGLAPELAEGLGPNPNMSRLSNTKSGR